MKRSTGADWGDTNHPGTGNAITVHRLYRVFTRRQRAALVQARHGKPWVIEHGEPCRDPDGIVIGESPGQIRPGESGFEPGFTAHRAVPTLTGRGNGDQIQQEIAGDLNLNYLVGLHRESTWITDGVEILSGAGRVWEAGRRGGGLSRKTKTSPRPPSAPTWQGATENPAGNAREKGAGTGIVLGEGTRPSNTTRPLTVAEPGDGERQGEHAVHPSAARAPGQQLYSWFQATFDRRSDSCLSQVANAT